MWPRLVINIVALALFAAAQERPVFRAGSDVVPVYVAVTSRDGTPVRGLTAEDFVLKDGGQLRDISLFSAERHPIAIALLIGGGVELAESQALPRAFMAAEALIAGAASDDLVAVAGAAAEIAPLSKDKSNVIRLLRAANGAGAFFHSLRPTADGGTDWAIRTLSAVTERRIAVVFTDGQNSGINFARAEKADVAVYPVAFDDSGVSAQFLRSFSATGGVASLVRRDADLRQVFAGYLDNLRMDYLIGFVPAKFDDKSHRIELKVKRPGVTVHARASYFAAKR